MDMVTSDRRPLAAVVAVLLWSTNAWTAAWVLARTEVPWLLTIEAGAAALTLGGAGLLARVRRSRRAGPGPAVPSGPPDRPDAAAGASRRFGPVLLAVVGLTGTMTLQYVAYHLGPLVACNVLTYAWPLAAAAWAAARQRTGAAVRRGLCAAIGFGGVAVMVLGASGGPAGADGAGTAPSLLGPVCALASAACMAVFTVGSGRAADVPRSRRVAASPRSTVTLAPAAAAAAVAGLVAVVVSGESAPAARVWLVAAAMGVAQMALGYRLWAFAMSAGDAGRLAGLGYLTPLISTVLLVATGSRAGGSLGVGVALILFATLGLLVIDLRERHARSGGRGTHGRAAAGPSLPNAPGPG